MTNHDGTLGNLPEQPTLPQASVEGGKAAFIPQRFGDYELRGELGRGGMGIVYRAYDPALGRMVAVKMVLPGALADEDDLRRFQREAAAAGRLQHPHIVSVHRVGVEDGRPFYSMDLIEGPSLSQRLARGPLPALLAARYLATVARAIHHAHEQGILHRDLKPGNVLIDQHDQPHVTDFGLAKHLSGCDQQHTQTGAVLGTPSYMAPEQASGKKDVGPACDVYGLGALLYELLTGRPPFRGETHLDTLMQVMQNDPVPPRLLNPKVPRDLETICLKCLQKSPDDRYRSAAELADDLERHLKGDSIQARSVNLLDRLARTLERSQLDVEFRDYGTMLYWFAALVGVMHVLKHVLLVTEQPFFVIQLAQAVQFLGLVAVLWVYRPKGLLATTSAERQLWSVWIGYLIACLVVSFVTYYLLGPEKLYEGALFPYYAVITGLAFFALGSMYWGRCYVVGLAWWLLAGVMLLDLRWAALEFGASWVIALLGIGQRLRRLGREREAT